MSGKRKKKREVESWAGGGKPAPRPWHSPERNQTSTQAVALTTVAALFAVIVLAALMLVAVDRMTADQAIDLVEELSKVFLAVAGGVVILPPVARALGNRRNSGEDNGE